MDFVRINRMEGKFTREMHANHITFRARLLLHCILAASNNDNDAITMWIFSRHKTADWKLLSSCAKVTTLTSHRWKSMNIVSFGLLLILLHDLTHVHQLLGTFGDMHNAPPHTQTQTYACTGHSQCNLYIKMVYN